MDSVFLDCGHFLSSPIVHYKASLLTSAKIKMEKFFFLNRFSRINEDADHFSLATSWSCW